MPRKYHHGPEAVWRTTQHVTADDFSRPGIVFQMGLPPVRIDVLTELTGLTFAEAWPTSDPRANFGPIER